MTAALEVRIEYPAQGVARVVLDRPRARNAQNLDLLYRLDDAFTHCLRDDSIRAIILAAEGPDFSAGHDLRAQISAEPAERFEARGTWSGFDGEGGHAYIARERELFFELTTRWRNLAKPTIAQVHGNCVAGGLILAWACDIIIAAEDARFCDPVVEMGVCGVEWFAHPWELGHRKAKELLLTAAAWSAREAEQMGMVNRVVSRKDLPDAALEMAVRIAAQPVLAAKLVKQAVNAAIDAQGQMQALEAAFQMHQVCHYHNRELFGIEGNPAGMPSRITGKVPRETT
ncbi:enoyl-CoA hydratase [Novosphingobium sp. 9U]|uniref:enoyl-CoA hydratase n=1 Tax=Novosphingobium sp. 9U TaxID=2653158 RepID=UPI0012EFD5A0|nr:enoyl-CoA hydratase [Novosphingobium sp. 9U]VWX50132.1 Putative enoyl-CoA hydratase EchA13 [Novosphingobium sp. 9U]